MTSDGVDSLDDFVGGIGIEIHSPHKDSLTGSKRHTDQQFEWST